MSEPSPYDVLGVSPEATASEIRSAFRDKVRASHPDTTKGVGDDRGVIEVVEAYRRLMARAAENAAAGRAESTVTRRVEVRRAQPTSADRVEPPTSLSCSECRGRGFVETRVMCNECRGSGTITSLEAHRARVVECRRCRGRGAGRVRGACSTCGGSGVIVGSSR